MSDDKTYTEEFKVSGDAVIAKIKELLHEGNIRRIIIKNEEGQTLIEIPLTIGVVGAILLPVWAAIGAIAALVVKLTIVVEKVEDIQQIMAFDIIMTPGLVIDGYVKVAGRLPSLDEVKKLILDSGLGS